MCAKKAAHVKKFSYMDIVFLPCLFPETSFISLNSLKFSTSSSLIITIHTCMCADRLCTVLLGLFFFKPSLHLIYVLVMTIENSAH